MNNRLYTIQEVANILGVSTKTLRRWDQRGRLVATRTVGNQRRYSQQQIDAFRNENKASSNRGPAASFPPVSARSIFSVPSAGELRAVGSPSSGVTPLFDLEATPKSPKATHSLPSALSGLPSGSILRNHFFLKHKDEIESKANLEPARPPASSLAGEAKYRTVLGEVGRASFARRPLAKLNPFKIGIMFASLVFILSLGGALVLTKYDLIAGLAEKLTEKKELAKFINDLSQFTLSINPKELGFAPADNQAVLAASDDSSLVLNVNVPAFFSQNIGIGTASPNTSAILDLMSESQGFLAPRMTETQLEAIETPAAGLFVYNTDTNHYNMYNGTAWQGVFTSIGDSTTGEAFTETGTSGTALYFYDADGRGKLTTANLGGIRTYTLPDASGEVSLLGQTISNSELVNAKVTVSPGTNMTGGGEVALGSSVTLTLKDSITLAGTLAVSGTTTLTGATTIAGATALNGALTANANVTLGDAATDTITFTGRVAQGSSLIPITATGTNDLGTSALPWDNVYADNVFAASAGTQGYWQRNSQAISPTNITDDVLLGATSTSSAKFAFLNVAGGTPTASVSANSGNNAATLTGLGVLGTTNMQTLTLGNSTTGNIVIDSGSSAITFSDTISPTTSDGAALGTTALMWSDLFLASGSVINLNNGDVTLTHASNALTFAGGNVGLGGQTTPLTELDVTGSASLSANFSLRGSGTAHTFDILDNGTLNFRRSPGGSSQVTSMFIQGDGNVGIGTASPSNLLHLTFDENTAFPLRLTRTGTGDFVFGVTAAMAGSTADFALQGTQANSGILFRSVNSGGSLIEAMGIDRNGNVGIGTLTPLELLHVGGNATASGNLTLSGAARTIQTTALNTLTLGGTTTGNIVIDSGSSAITLSDATTLSSTLSVTGNTTLTGDLAVNGDDITSDGNLTISATGYTRIGDTSTPSVATADDDLFIEGDLEILGGTATMSASTNTLSVGRSGTIQSQDLTTLTIGGTTTGAIALSPASATPSLFITNGGNVGIGTIAPDYRLHVVSAGSATAVSLIASIENSTTPTANGAGAALYFTLRDSGGAAVGAAQIAGVWSNYLNTGRVGDLAFYTRNAGADVVERMRIAGTGNVGIGITSPVGVLHVTGIAAGNAAAIVNNAGTVGDIFTASSSGTPRFVITNAGNVGIGTVTPTTFNLEIAGTIGATVGSTYDIGSSARRWATIYGDTGNFTNISGTVTGGSTSSSDWLINSDNATADTENASLTFERGTPATNAQFLWNSTTKQLSTNSPSFAILPDTTISYSGTAALIVNQVQSQDILTASSSGTPRFVITNAGNVGIGQTLPTEILGVTGSATISGTLTVDTVRPETGALSLQYKSGLNAWTTGLTLLDNSGNVGIGNTAPGTTLDVTGTLRASSTVTFTGLTASRAIFTDASSNLAATGVSANLLDALTDETGTGVSVFGTSPAITTSLTTPSTTFALVNTTATTVNFAQAATTLTMGATTGTATIRNATLDLPNGSATASGNLTLYGAARTIATTALNTLTIGGTTTGNIVIDSGSSAVTFSDTISPTTSDGAALGTTALMWSDLFLASGSVINLNNGDVTLTHATNALTFAGGNVGLGGQATPLAELDVTGSASLSANFSLRGSGTAHTFDILDNGTLNFRRSPGGSSQTTSMFIQGDGNVGIGTTAPNQKLEVSGVTISGDGSDASNGSLGYGIRYTGSNIINTFGSMFSSTATTVGHAVKPKSGVNGFVSSAGNSAFVKGALQITDQLVFSNAAGATVAIGTDVTMTERFRIDSSGNVGIGTTSPLELLHVAGNATASGNLTLSGGNRTIQTTALNTLTIGGTTTGNIVIDSGSSSITLSDAVTASSTLAVTGDTTLTGDLAVNGGDLTTTAATFNLVNAATTFNIGSTNIARTINLGTGTEIDTINIGTGATGVDVIRIGQAAADLALTDANWSISAAGLITTASDIAVNGDDITSDGNLTISATGYTRIGDTSTPSVATADDDLFIEGDLEILGGTATMSASTNTLSIGRSGTIQSQDLTTLTIGGTTTGAIALSPASATPSLFVTNGGNVGIGNTAPGTTLDVTGTLRASSTVTFTGLTASRAIFTDASSNLAATGVSANLLDALTDETGTGVSVFGTSPAITTSLTTPSTTFALVNTTATTVNFAQAATTLTMGATTGTATIRNATLDLPNGSATASGNLTLYGAARTIATTALNTLTIGGTTTGNIVIDSGSSAVTFSDTISPTTSDGAALGTTALMWSDLFLASGSVINLNNGDVTLTHATNALTFAGGNVGLGGQATPLAELDVTGSASLSANFSLRGSGTAHTFDILDNGTLNFRRSPGGSSQVTSMFIQGDGNVGIGTATPATRLHVSGGNIRLDNNQRLETVTTAGAIAPLVFEDTSNNIFFSDGQNVNTVYLRGTAGLSVASTGVVSLSVLNVTGAGNSYFTGNVGIGTTSPLELLHVAGNATASGNLTLSGGNRTIQTTALNTLTIGGTTTGNIVIDSGSSAITFSDTVSPTTSDGAALGTTALMWSDLFLASGSVINLNNGDVTLTHASNVLGIEGGNVGIGNTAPLAELGITGSATISGTLTVDTVRPETGALSLQYKSGLNAWTTGLTLLDNSGNVGIGNTAPGTTLDVTGTLRASSTVTFTGLTASRAIFTDASSNLAATGVSANLLDALTDETGTGVSVFGTSPAITTSLTTPSTTFALVNTTATTVNFAQAATTLTMGATTGTASIRNATVNLPNATRVGIGNTSPSTWYSGATTTVVQIGGGRSQVYDYADETHVNNNALFNASGSFERQEAAGASDYYQLSGSHVFRVAGTGSAGSAITFKSAMAVDSEGNVGIGTASPTNQLHVTRPLSFGATGKALAVFDQIESQDILTASASGTTRFVIKNDGNVGIGTALPSAKMDLRDGSLYLSDADVVHGLTVEIATTNDYAEIGPVSGTAGGLLLRGLTDATGNAIYLLGTIGATNPTDTDAAIRIVGAKSGGGSSRVDLGALETVLSVANNDDAAAMVVLGNGNVGIGTTSPGSILDLQAAGGALTGGTMRDILRIENTTATATNNSANMSFFNLRSGAIQTPVASISGVMTDNGATTYTGALVFSTAGTAAVPTERMRITAGGNVGIGTTSPAADLSLSKGASTANTTLRVENTTNSGASHAIADIAVGGTTSTGDPQLRWTIPGGTSFYAGVENDSGGVSTNIFHMGTGTAVGTSSIFRMQGDTTVAGADGSFDVGIGLNAISQTFDAVGGGRDRISVNIGARTVTFSALGTNVDLNGSLNVGATTFAQTGGAVTISNAFGVNATHPAAGASVTLTDAAAFRARVGAAGGTLTNTYGLYVEAMTQGTNNYGARISQPGIANGIGATTDSLGLYIPAATTALGDQTATTTNAMGINVGIQTYTSTTLTRTVTNPASIYIQGAPVASTNVSFTNGPYALWVDAGTSRFDGNVGLGGQATPLAELDVTGSASLSANISLRGSNTAHLFNILQGGTLNFTRSPGGDTVSTTSMFIQGDGNVGIGTTSPSNLLHLTTDENTASLLRLTRTGTGDYIFGVTAVMTGSVADLALQGTQASSGIIFRAVTGGGSTINAMGIDRNGNVGIGNTTPLTALDVTGSASLSANVSLRGSGTAHTFNILDNGTLNIRRSVGGDVAFVPTLLFLNSNGDVGIGTTNPGLQEAGAPGDRNLVIDSSTLGNNRAGNIELAGSANSAGIGNAAGRLTITIDGDDIARIAGYRTAAAIDAGQLSFLTAASGGTLTERMVIDPSGNVGIGTTAPAGNFDVIDTDNQIYFQKYAASSSQPIINFRKSRSATVGTASTTLLGDYFVTMRGMGVDTNNAWREAISIDYIQDAAAGSNFVPGSIAILTTNAAGVNAERVRITSAGNVGIGITAPVGVLHVNGIAAGNAAAIVNNAGSVGDIFTASSSGTPRFVITNAGNVGIGTALPTATLQVASANGVVGTDIGNLFISTTDSQAIDKGGYLNFGGIFTGTSVTNWAGIAGRKENGTDNNYAGYLALSTRPNGGNDTERMRINSAGNVGIGTASPTSELHVTRPLSFGANGKALAVFDQIESQDILTASASGTTKFVVDNAGKAYLGALDLETSNTTATCWFDNTINGATLKEITDCNGAPTDLAENFGTSDASIEAGDVVVITGEAQKVTVRGTLTSKAFVKKSETAYQSTVVGVVSTAPSQVYGEDGVFEESENPRPVSLAGRVPVKVNTENGNILVGDPITSSSTPGIGMKATKSGRVIGMALEAYTSADPAAVGKVIVFVNPHWMGTSKLLALDGNDRLGIGTTTPSFKLDVQDMQIATAAAQIFNTATGTDADGLVIKLGNTSTTAVAQTNHFINFETSGIGIVGSIQGNGANGVTYATSGVADFAEYFKKDSSQTIEFGKVVCLSDSGLTVPCDSNNGKILGIASERPAFLGGINLGNGSIAVGLVGQVETFVSNANGEIKPGDPLTASDVPGVAVKAIKAGQIVGKAVEPFAGAAGEVGKILVSVNIGWYDPTIYIALDGTLGGVPAEVSIDSTIGSALQGDALQDQIASGSAQMNYVLENDPLFKDLKDKVSALESKLDLLNLQFDQQASISGQVLGVTLDATAVISNVINASASASLVQRLGDVELNNATISEDLMVLGRTTVTDLGVTGTLSAGVLAIHGLDGEINTLSGDLYLQKDGLGGVNIFNGKIVMDTKGNLTVAGTITAEAVEANNYTVLGQESIGSATIPAGSTSIEVSTAIASSSSKIFLTTTSLTDKQITVVEKKSGKFKVAIPQPTTSPISFDWWIVGNKN